MKTIHDIADDLGRKEIAAAVGVGPKAVSNKLARGLFPGAWWLGMANLAAQKGVTLPERLFDWSLPDEGDALDNPPSPAPEETAA